MSLRRSFSSGAFAGVKLDDQVHIGHNCEIGEYSSFSGQTGISGSTRIGKWCLFGGQVGCADHATIGDRVIVAAQAGIHSGLKDHAIVGGSPAVDVRKYRRNSAALLRLPDLIRRVRALENRSGIGGNGA